MSEEHFYLPAWKLFSLAQLFSQSKPVENRNCETVLIVRDEEKFENQACGLQPRSRKFLRKQIDKWLIKL